MGTQMNGFGDMEDYSFLVFDSSLVILVKINFLKLMEMPPVCDVFIF